MRLTLRTLLAYLDEILDPHDAEQLRRKIQDSEFATALVHQIRGSIRRLRLDAPALDAQGIGGDVNSVAEYLDNTLPPDQVPALEKVCLEHEMHLGEVASCHQILTLVLGEAADVTDKMRQRAYAIAPTAQDAAAGTAVAEAVSEPTDVPAADRVASGMQTTKEIWRAESRLGLPEEGEVESEPSPPLPARPTPVPTPRREYLEPSSSSWLRSAVVTLVIALLILCGWMFAAGTWQQPQLLARWLGEAPAPATDDLADVTTDSSAAAAPELVPPAFDSAVSEPAAADPVELPAAESEASPPSRFEDDSTGRFSNTIRPTDPRGPAGSPLLDIADEPPVGLTPPDQNITPLVEDPTPPDDEPLAVVPPTHPPVTETDSSLAEKQDIEPKDTLNFDEIASEPVAVEVDPTLPEKDTTFTPDVPPAPDVDATATSRRATNSSATAAASTVPLVDPSIDLEPAEINPPVASPAVDDTPVSEVVDTTELVPIDDDVVAQPEMVPSAGPTTLKADHVLLAYDGSQADWQSAEAGKALEPGTYLMCLPRFQSDVNIGSSIRCSFLGATRIQMGPDNELVLHDGRLLLKNRAANRLQGIRFQNDRLDIKMSDEDTLVAIEAIHEHIPGTDVSELPHSILRIHAVKNATTVDMLGQSYPLTEGQFLLAVDNYPPRIETASKSPSWTSIQKLSADEKMAVVWREPLKKTDNLRVWLLSQASRRYAQASLAARCLAEIDEFAPIVATLNDPEQRAYWDQAFETLRRSLARGSETVAKLQVVLEKVYGPEAPFVLEMIRGYSEGQLASGAASQLVSHLEHPRLDFRVLAIQNLKAITSSTHRFSPEKTSSVRRPTVDEWRKRLRQGHVRYKQPPQVVTLLESFEG